MDLDSHRVLDSNGSEVEFTSMEFGQYNDGFDYALDGTPCKNVIGQCYRYYSNNVQALFPDQHLREVVSMGYAAIPLFASTGRPIGIMAVIDTKPLTQPDLTESLLKIFAVRAALELEQRYVLAAKQRSDANLKVLFEATDQPVAGAWVEIQVTMM